MSNSPFLPNISLNETRLSVDLSPMIDSLCLITAPSVALITRKEGEEEKKKRTPQISRGDRIYLGGPPTPFKGFHVPENAKI